MFFDKIRRTIDRAKGLGYWREGGLSGHSCAECGSCLCRKQQVYLAADSQPYCFTCGSEVEQDEREGRGYQSWARA